MLYKPITHTRFSIKLHTAPVKISLTHHQKIKKLYNFNKLHLSNTIMTRYIFLTATGLTPGGSSTGHIYIQTIRRTTQSVNKKCSANSIIMTILLATLLISHTKTCVKVNSLMKALQGRNTLQHNVECHLHQHVCTVYVHILILQLIVYVLRNIPQLCLKEHPSIIQVYWVVTL
jgi:hypothetical protein